MKLTLLFLCVCILQLAAKDLAAQQVTLSQQQGTLEAAFRAIKQQTGYDVLCKLQHLRQAKPVTVHLKEASLPDAMQQILEGQDLEYSIDNKTIIVRSRPETSKIRNMAAPVQQVIQGKVTTADNQPLVGVSVLKKGTQIGTTTNAQGDFSLAVDIGDILVFKYLGYVAKEVTVASLANLPVQLLEYSNVLDEVVAIGYGTMKKSDLTGAIASVDGELLETRKTTQLSQALQGALPGVTVTRTSGDPKEGSAISIRGVTSINGSNPLVVVDGVPGVSIDNVNARDVESVTVLKDGASAAIYGARAAAGVILITTKRAKKGEVSINYDFNYGFDRPSALPESVDAQRWMEISNEIAWNKAGNDDNEYPLYAPELIDNYYTLNAEDPDTYPITDWYDLVLKDIAPRRSHSIRLALGAENVKSSVSIVYEDLDQLPKSETDISYKRLSFRSNNELTINKYWKASADIYYRRAESKNFNNSGMEDGASVYTQLFYYAPIYPAVWSNGTLAPGLNAQNLYGMLNYRGFDNYWNDAVGGRVALDFSPLPGLKLSAVVAPNIINHKRKIYYTVVPYYEKENPNTAAGYLRWSMSNDLDEYRENTLNITSQLLANYDKKIGNHTLSAMAGYEQYSYHYETLTASSDQLALAGFPYLDLNNPNYITNSGSATENAYRSFFGRVSYNYLNKYHLQVNTRYDGSSRFHPDHRWGFFPSVSAGWVLTEEPFFKGLTSSVNFLKLRASWGRLGNERIGNYPYQSTISFGNAHVNQGANKVSVQTAAQRAFAVEDITWETTESYNLGLDVNLINNRLSVSGDYFKKNTKDMLLRVAVPNFSGLTDPQQNAGIMETKGWELLLKWNDNAGDFRYGISANLSDNKSKIVDLKGTEFLGAQIIREGSEYYEWFGYRTLGLFQTQEDLDNSAVINSNQKVGDIKYMDISGPDGTPDGIINSYDQVLLGGSQPRYLYGLNVDLKYKNLDLSLMFQGVAKRRSRMQGLMYYALPGDKGNIPKIIDGNYWSHYNTVEENLNAQYPRLEATSGSAYTFSDMWLFDGSYFRMKNITLGYNMPSQIFRQAYFKSMRIYASITDLFSFSNYPTGWDPEAQSSTYPIATSFVFGVSINL